MICAYVSRPRESVLAWWRFTSARSKGVGRIYQQTFIDTYAIAIAAKS
jgi:hypothetical protein